MDGGRNMTSERTFVMVKPDGVQRGLVGRIVQRFEEKGLKIAAGKFMHISPELAQKHYEEHREKPFFNDLVGFITSGPVFAVVLEGQDAIHISRLLIGKTDPKEAPAGTIRGDYGHVKEKNVIHGSDSLESADREIGLFFKPEEVLEYERSIDAWL